MVSSKAMLSKSFEEIATRQISIDKAYKIAIRAMNKKDKHRANRIIAIISRAIKEDGNNGCYTGKVRFVGTNEYELIGVDDIEI